MTRKIRYLTLTMILYWRGWGSLYPANNTLGSLWSCLNINSLPTATAAAKKS